MVTFIQLLIFVGSFSGDGVIHQEIFSSKMYYIAVGNLNSEEVEVIVNFFENFPVLLSSWNPAMKPEFFGNMKDSCCACCLYASSFVWSYPAL